ncbi:MAG: TonB-dependent receptor [candidate division KSB1 bacterium]|nr:TonB-dependent receptor [candidate division KSB1 bacterium]
MFFCTGLIFGQGTLKGVVIDSSSESVLPGANVYFEGMAFGAAADIDGEYRVTNIPPGTYQVKVSYIGYLTKSYTVQIQQNQTAVLNAELTYETIQGQMVTVTAQAEGQVAAINQQITSNTIINVISEEKIQELPDANAAEAIGRLPGISLQRSGGEANMVLIRGMQAKFSPVTVDGVRIPSTEENSRGVDLSTLSQSSLAGIELYKAVTPDMDGDALSGTINLVTKKAPEERLLRTTIKGNYNELTNSANQYDLSFRYGERFFNDILGVQLSGNLDKKIRSNESIRVSGSRWEEPLQEIVMENFDVQYVDEIRSRNGLSLLLDVNTPDGGSIRFNNVYGGTQRDYLTHRKDYPLNGDQTTYDYRQREQNINTFNSSIHGDNHLLGLDINWGVSYAESKSDYPFDYQLIFYEINGMQAPYPLVYDYDDVPNKVIPLARNNFTEAWQAWGYYRNQDNVEKELTSFINIAKSYRFSNNITGELKVGAKFKNRKRTNKTSEDFSPYYLDGQWKFDELAPDGSVRPKDFTGTYFEDWFNAGANGGAMPLEHFFSDVETRDVYDDYKLSPIVDKKRLKQWHELNKNGVDPTGNRKEVWGNPLTRVNDYDIEEKVNAFYIMNTLKLGPQVTFTSGLRSEYENNDYLGYYMKSRVGGFPLAENVLFDTTSTADQLVLLPNFHLAYEPTDYLKIRLASYKALARPDFNMRIDRYVGGRGAVMGSPFNVQVGNINLKTAKAWNYEINTSVYQNNLGLVSLSAYYKEIENMYHMLSQFGTSGEDALQFFGSNWKSNMGNVSYDLSIPYNSNKPTKVWGVEFEHQINFHFLPSYLSGIVLSYNASAVRSETQLYVPQLDSVFVDPPGPIGGVWKYSNSLKETMTKLEGQPEFFYNIALGYDIGGFSGRVSVFHQAEYNNSIVSKDYRINLAFTRVDIALRQRINDSFSVFFNVNNLTNFEDAIDRKYGEYDLRKFSNSERYGRTIDLGVIAEL